MAKSLTSANCVIMLSVAGLFPVPQQLQGFAAEDIFDADAVDNAETVMGVDGKMSAGWIPNIIKLGITLQADSDSIAFFERWYAAEQSVREKYFATGSIYLRAVEREFILTRGALRNYAPLPNGKKILQPRKFTIDWEAMSQGAI